MQLELNPQLESPYQKKSTKALLKKQSALVERLLSGIQYQFRQQQQHQATESSTPAAAAPIDLQPMLDRGWHEVRVCVKQLHAAKLTQHYLSGLYIQSRFVKWISHARRRAHDEERARALDALNA